MADFSWSDDEAIQELDALVKSNPDDYESWEKLVIAAENQDGGLNRNSNPLAIAAMRQVYDNFLLRFPLFYGFWLRYADREWHISGSDAAEAVFERAIADFPYSTDVWTAFCKFRGITCHDTDMISDTQSGTYDGLTNCAAREA